MAARWNGARVISAETLQTMLTPVWRFDPIHPNGNNYGGLMRQWGLGIQQITDHSASGYGDRLVQNHTLKYVGHCGDAYGLLSGLWVDSNSGTGFTYLLKRASAHDLADNAGKYSSFTRWEEHIMTILHSMVLNNDASEYTYKIMHS